MNVALICLAGFVVLTANQFVWSDDKPATQPAKPELVDFHKLEDLMPADLAGLKRSSNDGERVNTGKYFLSRASAEYAKDNAAEKDPSITIEIGDYAGAPTLIANLNALMSIHMDQKTDAGYEKTTKVKDQPAHESYDAQSKSGEVQVLVAGRFLVSVKTENLSPEDMRKAAESLPLDKLAALK